MTKKLQYGVCRFCGCQEKRACAKSIVGKKVFGCSWTGPDRRACTACVPAPQELLDLFGLVMGGGKSPMPTLATLQDWNDEERFKTGKILSRIHLQASDNVVLRRWFKIPKVAMIYFTGLW